MSVRVAAVARRGERRAFLDERLAGGIDIAGGPVRLGGAGRAGAAFAGQGQPPRGGGRTQGAHARADRQEAVGPRGAESQEGTGRDGERGRGAIRGRDSEGGVGAAR